MSSNDVGHSDYGARKVQAMHSMLMTDKPNIDVVRQFNLEDTSLEYLDMFFTTAFTSPPSSEPHKQSLDLIALTADLANPRELVLAVGEQVEKLGDALNACLMVDEDEDEDGVQEEREMDEVAAESSFRVHLVALRLRLAIDCYAAAIPRLRLKSPLPTLSQITDSLGEALDMLVQARTYGLAFGVEDTVEVMTSICRFVRAAVAWLGADSERKAGADDVVNGKATLDRLLCKYITSFGDQLDMRLLETWFVDRFPDRIVSGKGKAKQDDGEVVAAMDEAVETLSILGHSLEDLFNVLQSSSPSDNPFLPITALRIVAFVLAHRSRDGLLDTLAQPPAAVLSSMMPLLGSALNGLAVDAATTVVWALVDRVRRTTTTTKTWLAEGDASMLIELIVPNMARDESEMARYACHTLIGAIIDSCEPGLPQIMLFDQLVSPDNPFENVRVSSLTLLRDAVTKSDKTNPILSSSFHDIIGSKVFVLPPSEPPLDTMRVDELVDSMWLGWIVEVLNLLYLLVSKHAFEALGIRDESGFQALYDELLTPLTELSDKWYTDLSSLEDETARNHLSTSLFAIDDALNRTTQAIASARSALESIQ